MKSLLCTFLIIAIVLPFAGCASPTPAPTLAVLPTDPPIPEPTATLAPTPIPTPTLEPTPFISDETIEKIDKLLINLSTEQEKFAGIALVAYQGKVVLHKAYGMKDKEENTPFTTDDLMLLGDVGIVNSGILMLNDEGKLSLDDSICLYISECPEHWQPLTVNDVLHQRTGIPDPYAKLNAVQVDELWSRPDRIDEMIRIMRERPLEGFTAPGTAMISAANQAIKVKIIEASSGQSAREYLAGALLAPLGIKTIGLDYPAGALPKGYTSYGLAEDHDLLPDNMTFPNFVTGTVSDFNLLLQEYLNPKILSEKAYEHLWQEDGGLYPADTNSYGGDYYWVNPTVNLLGVTKVYAPNIPNGSGTYDIYSYSEGYGLTYFVSTKDQLVIILSSNEKNRDLTIVIKMILDWITG